MSIFKQAQASIRKIEGVCEMARLDGFTITKWELEQVRAICVPNYIKVWPKCPGGGSWNFDRDEWVAAGIGNATIYSTNVYNDVKDDM